MSASTKKEQTDFLEEDKLVKQHNKALKIRLIYSLVMKTFYTLLIILLSSNYPLFGEDKEITILHTNDFHSAFDPIPAYWLEGSPNLGGAAHLSTLINQLREMEDTVFLFDSGDMFTGMLANLTEGEALMEMMMTLNYDAFGIGNHEFDYGIEPFKRGINRGECKFLRG